MGSWESEYQGQVLSTLNADGSRHWLRPRISRGRFFAARRVVGYGLVAVFVLIPHLRLNGKPLMLLDVATRQFTFFGQTFLPTDTLLLAIFLVGCVVSIFLITALLGRIWCGWLCPQLVYLEFVYRPLEYLLDGRPGAGGARGRRATSARTVVKYALFLVISLVLAHTFLAYFVGVEPLSAWLHGPPLQHSIAFATVMLTTGLMMFNFCYFREQTCILACPYGRLQSVMLDRDSLIISYDALRGEPRGKASASRNAPGPARGDCVDCRRCVETCPTGIDIREGLQLECVACAQCIDACDAVMDALDRPRGLVRYSSQARMARQPARLIRPRVIAYPAVLLALLGAFGFTLASREPTQIAVLSGFGAPFTENAAGEIINRVRVRITNRSSADARYTLRAADPAAVRLVGEDAPVLVPAGKSQIVPVALVAQRERFHDGQYRIELSVSDGAQFNRSVTCRLLGPRSAVSGSAAKEPRDG